MNWINATDFNSYAVDEDENQSLINVEMMVDSYIEWEKKNI